MRGHPRLVAALAALTAGAVVGCYSEDYLLGAFCVRDDSCGDDQCCDGVRCRPSSDCTRESGYDGAEYPFAPAYKPCDSVDTCITHGLVRCVHLEGAEHGFCTDLCVGDPELNCELPATGYPFLPVQRICVDADAESVCAVGCSATQPCPDDMECRTDVCVPKP